MAEKAKTKKQAPIYILYLLSVVFGVIGSLGAWFLLRKQAAFKARQCLFIGISSTVIVSAAVFIVPLMINTWNQPRYTSDQVLTIAKQFRPECKATPGCD
jgi:hypothetical protein